MASEHPEFTAPANPDIKIWRYMSFPKFVSLVAQEALFFASPDMFDDRLEGSYSHAPVIVDQDALIRNGATDPVQYVSELEQAWAKAREIVYPSMYINCWHMNETESDGMWRLYGDPSQSVCIQSTFTKLWNCTGDDVFVGVVKYVDYSSEEISPTNMFRLFMQKRKCFAHEQELRAIVHRIGASSPGLGYKVKLTDLIESICLPPRCQGWFAEVVQSVVTRYGLGVPIMPSSLDMEPGRHPKFVLDPSIVTTGSGRRKK